MNLSYSVINDVMAEKWASVNKFLASKEYDKLEPQLKFLAQSGIDDSYFVNLNLGVCFYKRKNVAHALYYLEKASYLKPCFEVYNYLFKICSELGTIIKTKYYCEIMANFKDQEKFIKLKMNLDKTMKYKTKKLGKYTIKQIMNQKTNTKPIICYYTGNSGNFNGKNYMERDAVWGSEIAAIKLCESLAKIGYEPHIFCKCDEEIVHNGVVYHKDSKFQNFQYSHKINYLTMNSDNKDYIEPDNCQNKDQDLYILNEKNVLITKDYIEGILQKYSVKIKIDDLKMSCRLFASV